MIYAVGMISMGIIILACQAHASTYYMNRSSVQTSSYRYQLLNRQRHLETNDSNASDDVYLKMSLPPTTSPSIKYADETRGPASSTTNTNPPTLSPSPGWTYKPSYITRKITEIPTVASTAPPLNMNLIQISTQPSSIPKQSHSALPTNSPSLSINTSKNNAKATTRTLAISLPIVGIVILILFGASVKWSCCIPSKTMDSEQGHTTLIRKTLDQSPSRTLLLDGHGIERRTVTVSPTNSSDLHLLETLSSESDESNRSPLWIQMSEYGQDDTCVSAFDECNSRCGDWYDDFSCNYTISSVNSV